MEIGYANTRSTPRLHRCFVKEYATRRKTFTRRLLPLLSLPISSLRATWDVIRQETMQLGDDHMTLAARLNTEIERPVKELR